MSVLNREEFFARLDARLASDTSDEGIAFLEDMTDTYNDLERRATGDGVDWESRYKELDDSWKKRYRHRFFSSGGEMCATDEVVESDGYSPEDVSVDDLFTKKEEK